MHVQIESFGCMLSRKVIPNRKPTLKPRRKTLNPRLILYRPAAHQVLRFTAQEHLDRGWPGGGRSGQAQPW